MTPNQVKLTEYWLDRGDEALDAARVLFDLGYFRQSYGRSYYAMFYGAKALIVELKLRISKHKGVISAFDLHYIKTDKLNKDLSKWIHDAFDLRQQADYSESFEPDPDNSKMQILRAEAFMEETKSFLAKQIDRPNA